MSVASTPTSTPTPTGGDADTDDGGGWGEVVDALSDLTGDLAEAFSQVLFETFWQPWLDLLHETIDFIVFLIGWMPPTTLPAVVEVHRDVYLVSAALGAAGFVVTGLAYIGYGPAGLNYRRLRPVIPKLLAALVFGAAAPWLLAPVVDLSEAVAVAFAPRDPAVSSMLVAGGGFVVIGFVQSAVLLAAVLLFGVVKLWMLVGVAASPLIAMLWAIPWRYTQAKADALIGAWWAALLVGPFDMIVFKLTLALLSFEGFDAAGWVVGLAGPLLMIGVPWWLFSSSGVAAAAPAMAAARGTTQAVSNRVDIWNWDGSRVRQTSLDEFGGNREESGSMGPTPGERESRFKTPGFYLDNSGEGGGDR